MKSLLLSGLILLSPPAFAHGGGGSGMESEFGRTSHMFLPVSYSTTSGLAFDLVGLDLEATGADLPEDTHGDEMGLELEFHPEVDAGFSRIKRKVITTEAAAPDLVIERAAGDRPHVLIESRSWDLGLGLVTEAHLPIPSVGVGIGISYLTGRNYYSLRNFAGAEVRRPLALPTSPEALAQWRVGDELTYSSRGGVMFNLIIGIDPIAKIGPQYAHTGIHRFRLRREDEATLEIEVVTVKTDRISVEGSSVVLDAEAGVERGVSRSVVYEVDLAHPEALRVIDLVLRGRLDLANEFVFSSAGKIGLRTDLNQRSASLSGTFGVPFVYFNNRGAGVYQNSGTARAQGAATAVFTTTFSREGFTRGALSKQKWENQSVMSTIFSGPESLIAGAFSWSFSIKKASADLVGAKLRKLHWIFGYPTLSQLRFRNERLGYVKADFLVNLSGREIIAILAPGTIEALEARALADLEAEFDQSGSEKFCRLRSYSNCLLRYSELVRTKARALRGLREEIEVAYQGRGLARVTHKLSALLRVLFSSRYLSRAFVATTPTLKAELRLEGEKIERHRFEL
jgi:hypothetical protein